MNFSVAASAVRRKVNKTTGDY